MNNPFARAHEAEAISDVNVVPLADVSLVLLIILLVLSPMAAQSMLKVASAAAKAEDKGPKPGVDPLNPPPPEPVLTVGLSAEGYTLDGVPLGGDAELRRALLPKLYGREDRKVFLAPELETRHERVVAAVEQIHACGASSVALIQLADPEPPR